MGMYDTVWFTNQQKEEIEIQFKCSDCILKDYEIGDEININDGIYFEVDACFVVYGSKIVAEFDKDDCNLFNKWGEQITFPEIQRYNGI